jgi:hypothetical protein
MSSLRFSSLPSHFGKFETYSFESFPAKEIFRHGLFRMWHIKTVDPSVGIVLSDSETQAGAVVVFRNSIIAFIDIYIQVSVHSSCFNEVSSLLLSVDAFGIWKRHPRKAIVSR